MQLNGSLLTLLLTGSLAVVAPNAQASTSFADTRIVTQTDGHHTRSSKGVLTLNEAEQGLSFAGKTHSVVIPYGQITSMRLEQTVERLREPFTGRVQHQEFLTLTYGNGDGHPTYALFQLNGRSYREVVAALEAQTNKRVDRTSY